MKYNLYRKIFFSFVFIFIGCATTPSSLPWLDVEWKKFYERAKNGSTTYYYGTDYSTIIITKSFFTFQQYTNEKLLFKQTHPVLSVDEEKTIVSYDCSTITQTRRAVVMCKVGEKTMEITNYIVYISNKLTSALSTNDLMEEFSALGFTKK